MSFRSFDGQATRTKRVALGGKSRAEESREQVLERTRVERERRRQHKLENKSAATIQAVWRSWRCVRRHKAAVRSLWIDTYGVTGERANSDDLRPTGAFLPQLVYFADPTSLQDLPLLAAACSLILSSRTPDGRGLQFCAAAAAGAAPHAGQPSPRAVLAQRTQRLLALSMRSMAQHAPALQGQLSAPRQPAAPAGAAGEGGLRGGEVSTLVEAVVTLVGGEAWKPFIPPPHIPAFTAHILGGLLRAGLAVQMATLALWASPPPVTGTAGAAAATPRRAVPAGETLVTALVVQCLALAGPLSARLPPRAPPPAPPPLRTSLAALLCVPLLVPRCPSLRPLGSRLWHVTLEALEGAGPWELAAALPRLHGLGPAGAADAAAALLGNLVDAAPAALAALAKVEGDVGGRQGGRGQAVALCFVRALTALLQLLPLEPFFPPPPGSTWEEGEAADAEGFMGIPRLEAGGGPGGVGTVLQWGAELAPPAGTMAQIQGLCSAQFLRALVAPILHSGAQRPADEATAGTAGEALRHRGGEVRALCALLYRLMQLPGQRQRVLIGLAVSAELAPRLWTSYLREAQAAGGEGWSPSQDGSFDPGWMLTLTLFSLAFSSFMITAGDDEMYERQRPLPLRDLFDPGQPQAGVLAALKGALWHALWLEVPPAPGGWSAAAAGLRQALKEAAGKLLSQLYDRNCRREFAPPEAFQAEGLPSERFHSEMQAGAAAGRALAEGGSSRAWGLLTYAPCLVPFRERAKVFQAVVSQARTSHRDMDVAQSLGMGREPNRFIVIRRSQLLQDGYDRLSALGEGLRGRVRVQFISEHGLEEAGVDGGGIFKEFLEEVVKEGFNPQLGLFLPTTDQRMYPNPHVREVMGGGGGLRLVEFLGRVVGKAMYEGILVDLPLAGFFLKKFRGMYCDIGDLPTLDPQLHKSLMFLKRYQGDVQELGLTFTVSDNVLGQAREIELVPDGANVALTNDNVMGYIHRVADYKLNQQIREPAAAFLRGLHTLIEPEWVSMFNEEELQMLISGGQQGLDIAEMRDHVQYSGGYHPDHPVIKFFWEALASLPPPDQGDFLRFVTSCPRPPLLGFKYLEPPLCIQMAGSVLDPTAAERLPTAATCMNLLKLPPYTSVQQIRDKLLYAIKAGAGFELS